ncbi:MAG: TIGR03619 family F420-dependent LLM class oxidoreductase [Acidimicrobiales bacterium]
MKFGYLSTTTAGIRPDHLATELEARGFDSIWMPEHSHIPADRTTPYPSGGELPSSYYHMMDPLLSLMAAASASSTLELYTGICLVLEHDLLDLACATASLDVLSNGRFKLGIGVGWNEEELANHRPDLPFKLRYSAMRERVAALRTCWGDERASFDGRWDSFTDSYVYPKPVRGTVPVALGNAGPVGIQHAAEYADEWCPIDASMLNTNGRPDVAGAIEAVPPPRHRGRPRRRRHPHHDPLVQCEPRSFREVRRARGRADRAVPAQHECDLDRRHPPPPRPPDHRRDRPLRLIACLSRLDGTCPNLRPTATHPTELESPSVRTDAVALQNEEECRSGSREPALAVVSHPAPRQAATGDRVH